MTQNIYDSAAFFEGYSRLDRSIAGLDGAAEWPAMQALLPELHDLKIVDLGCGFGWFCRWARARGAASVLGLDLSENMLARARRESTDPAITYARGDLQQLDLPEASFDLAYSSLAWHYIEHPTGPFTTVYRALVPGGCFVFSTEHPIYMAPSSPGFVTDQGGRRTWPVDRYLLESPRTTDWLGARVVKYHRTIATTLNLLIGAGFCITRVEEWGPTDAQIAAHPEWAEARDRPMFLLVSARKS
jgi:ubiquinone/menaquinone biosynthesis C-methylase UbiE